MPKTNQSIRPLLVQAFDHLQAAIELLDRAAAPGQIAAHVDLAVHQLFDELSLLGGSAVSERGAENRAS